jgi:hypothetical protein
MTARFDEHGNAIVGNVAIPAALVPDFRALLAAEAWDEGHKTRWRRGMDECICSAWSSSECGCGLYGTGELLSLGDNPYRKGAT